MKKLSMLFALLGVMAFVGGAAAVDNQVSLGPGNGTVIPSPDTNPCPGSTLFCNADGSYENGFTWQYGGVVQPYWGSFAECYFGAGNCCGIQLNLSTLTGFYLGQTLDAYVWDDNGGPNNVLGVTVGVAITTPGTWPVITQHDIDIADVGVGAAWWPGYWGNWPGALAGWFIGADTNGFGGCPYTYIAPGIGYPTGWNNASVVWGPVQALGICAYWMEGDVNPTETRSWGAIKNLYN
jgi:hypothetical protein